MTINEQEQNLCEPRMIAQIFGFSGVRRIEQLTSDGVIDAVIVTVDGHKVRRYDLIPTMQKYIAYLSNKAHGKVSYSEREMALREQKLLADLALKESQGELHKLKTQIIAGEYIPIEEVKFDYAKFFMIFKKFAMSLPSRITGMISGLLEPLEIRKIEKEMSKEITSLLNSFVIAGVVESKDVKGILNDKTKKMAEEISS